jgi:putative oxidoreductase
MSASPSVSTQRLSAPVSISGHHPAAASAAEVAGRFFLALLFVLSGLGKLGAYTSTAAYMSATGVPGALLPAVIATELLGGLAIVLGWKARIAALLMAGFSLLTALIFHNHLADQTQLIMFFKNISIAGGFLLLAAHGAGPLSLDGRAARHAAS